jgi:hypothetical protein
MMTPRGSAKERKHNGLLPSLLACLDTPRRYLSVCSSTLKYAHVCKTSRKVLTLYCHIPPESRKSDLSKGHFPRKTASDCP